MQVTVEVAIRGGHEVASLWSLPGRESTTWATTIFDEICNRVSSRCFSIILRDEQEPSDNDGDSGTLDYTR
jgi:hypothetical protein